MAELNYDIPVDEYEAARKRVLAGEGQRDMADVAIVLFLKIEALEKKIEHVMGIKVSGIAISDMVSINIS